MRTRLHAPLGLALMLLVASSPTNPARAQGGLPVYRVRWIGVIAAPREPNPYPRGTLAPVLQSLLYGSGHILTANSEVFLDKLRKDEPNFEFRYLCSNTVTCAAGAWGKITVGPGPTDPLQAVLEDTFRVTPTERATVKLEHEGEYRWKSPTNNRIEVAAWKNGVRDRVVLGRTYCQGIPFLEDGRMILFIYTLVPIGQS